MAIYANSIVTEGPLLFISGQTPQKEAYVPEWFSEQLRLVLDKLREIMEEHKAQTKNIVKLTIYLTDAVDLHTVREMLGELYGEHKPAMTLVVVAGLIDPRFKLEIDAVVALKKE